MLCVISEEVDVFAVASPGWLSSTLSFGVISKFWRLGLPEDQKGRLYDLGRMLELSFDALTSPGIINF